MIEVQFCRTSSKSNRQVTEFIHLAADDFDHQRLLETMRRVFTEGGTITCDVDGLKTTATFHGWEIPKTRSDAK